MKVIITGGAGFIGSHLADAYISAGYDVVIIDDLSSGSEKNISSALSKGATFYKAQVQSESEILKIFEKEKPDIVNHHAAQKSVRDSVDHPIKDANTNLLGFLSILEAAKKTSCTKVLFASSGGVVYGEQEEFPASENHSKRPCSPYGVAKLASELYLDYYAIQWGFSAVALRYANIFGPRQDPFGEAGVIAIFCSRMMKNQDTVIYGTGRQTRDFVYVSDVVSANLTMSEALSKNGLKNFSAWNVGTAVETSILDLHKMLSIHAQYSRQPRLEDAKAGEQLRSSLSFAQIQREWGWRPQVDLGEALGETYRSFAKV